jgi:23S rRNA (cytosine1962-C5)-methyltransferase
MSLPPLILKKNEDRRLRAGHLWVFSNEVDIARTPLKAFQPGDAVEIQSSNGHVIGSGYVNPNSLISARILSRDPEHPPGRSLLVHRLKVALALRERLYPKPYYRLAFGESDGLPGLVVDRYGDVLSVQITTAGMERLKADVVAALEKVLKPAAILFRNDVGIRELEGLPLYTETALGTVPATVKVEEHGLSFEAPLEGGQKTGWFFDQRPNRDHVAALAKDARVLDVFCHIGAFGLRCAAAGAREVTLVDSSAPALAQAEEAAALNGVGDQVHVRRADAFDAMAAMAGEQFDIVVCDPPAFARSRKDADAGLRAYGRMARLAAPLVAPGGFLFVASCSYHAPLEAWCAQIALGLHRARRDGRILFTGGAGPDHPVHPHLPETAYLKTQLIQVL